MFSAYNSYCDSHLPHSCHNFPSRSVWRMSLRWVKHTWHWAERDLQMACVLRGIWICRPFARIRRCDPVFLEELCLCISCMCIQCIRIDHLICYPGCMLVAWSSPRMDVCLFVTSAKWSGGWRGVCCIVLHLKLCNTAPALALFSGILYRNLAIWW